MEPNKIYILHDIGKTELTTEEAKELLSDTELPPNFKKIIEGVDGMDQSLQQETLDQCQKYYDEVSKELGKKGFIWLENTETGQLMVYTRGEYRSALMEFLKTLK